MVSGCIYVGIIKYREFFHIYFYSLVDPEIPSGSENTSVEEDEPVILGFGIPAPPPSYKAAVKNTDVYKVITSLFWFAISTALHRDTYTAPYRQNV